MRKVNNQQERTEQHILEKQRQRDLTISASFLAVILSLFVLFLILPSTVFSETENRNLQQLPKFSLERLLSKKLTDEIETFVADQFPFRNYWVAMKSSIEEMRLQKENNGIYKGEDGYLLEKFAEPDTEKILKYVDAINKFAAKLEEETAKLEEPANRIKVSVMLVPTSVGMYEDKLPKFAAVYSQRQINQLVGANLAKNITYLDGFEFLDRSPKTSDIYYRTDHHWTTFGAYLAYNAFNQQKGWPLRPLDEFEILTVNENFLGSYHTRSQFSNVKPDSIQIFVPKKAVTTSLYISDDNSTHGSWYFDEYLDKKDKYSYFQGGVHAVMQMKSDLVVSDIRQNSLLVIKDSYAHSLLPFLALDIPQIDVLDMRFYNGNFSKYVMDNNIDEVLLVFNTSTFVESQEIIKLQFST